MHLYTYTYICIGLAKIRVFPEDTEKYRTNFLATPILTEPLFFKCEKKFKQEVFS